MLITIKFTRNDEYVAAQRLATGSNVPQEYDVEINPADLSEGSRRFLLQYGGGSYSDVMYGFGVDNRGELNRYCPGGGTKPICDGEPTPGRIDIAIAAAQDRVRDEVAKISAQREEAARQKEAEEKEKAARKEREKEARKILRAELNQLSQAKDDRDALSKFLREIPRDVLNETAERVAAGNGAFVVENYRSSHALKKEIEDAATVWIFQD